MVRYRSRRPDDGAIRARLRAIASERSRFGYRRVGLLLAREGVRLNHKNLVGFMPRSGCRCADGAGVNARSARAVG